VAEPFDQPAVVAGKRDAAVTTNSRKLHGLLLRVISISDLAVSVSDSESVISSEN
jgi:hypothetical protein